MGRLFFRLILRPLLRDPVRAALTTLAIALGVAVVLAIEMAGDAAAGSFRSSVESLTGDADFEISAPGGVPGEVAASLLRLPEPLEVRPRMESFAEVPESGRVVPFLGVDMVASAPGSSPSGSLGLTSLEDGDAIWLGRAFHRRKGERISLLVDDRVVGFTVAGVLSEQRGEAAVVDLSTADRLLGRHGLLDRILVRVPRTRSLNVWEAFLRRAIPSGLTLEPQGARTRENRRMLEAFRWNLRVLSYIALVVGAFLIYNTISVSVVRRRAEIGIVRAVGAGRAAVLGAFLGEAAVFGLCGSLLGTALGRLMAQGAVRLVGATVQSLYVSSTPAPVMLSANVLVFGLAVGIAISIAAAWLPAWEAAHVAPVEAMARGRVDYQARVHWLRNLLWAGALGVAAYLACLMPPVAGKPFFGYLGALLLIGAMALAIPAMVTLLTARSGRWMARIAGPEAMLAGRGLLSSLRRTSVLTAALATAIAMVIAVGIMVGSFRQTVALWMENQLQADLYLRPALTAAADRHPTLSAAIPDRIAALPEVEAVDRFRAYPISYQGLPATFAGGDTTISSRFGKVQFLGAADRKAIYARMRQGDFAVVSEPFANKHHVRAGDALSLSLAGRTARFEVLGIYYDYSSERGFIVVDRQTMLRYLPDPAPSNVAVYLKPGVSLDRGRAAVERACAGRQVMVFSNRTLREDAIRIFDRTFAITYALEGVAIVVAVMGIAGALLALVIDRRRELGLLRFLGASGTQARRLILFEAGLLGLFANLAGLCLGVALSLILIYVINRQSFGWTIQFHWPAALLSGGLALIFAATLLAGLYPARIAMRLNPIEVIHEE
jgi:putative ABC transport system permease protein